MIERGGVRGSYFETAPFTLMLFVLFKLVRLTSMGDPMSMRISLAAASCGNVILDCFVSWMCKRLNGCILLREIPNQTHVSNLVQRSQPFFGKQLPIIRI